MIFSDKNQLVYSLLTLVITSHHYVFIRFKENEKINEKFIFKIFLEFTQ